MIEGVRSTPLGFCFGVLAAAFVAPWVQPTSPVETVAPAREPGQVTSSREAGVFEAIGRVEDSLDRCCTTQPVEIPTPVCKCGLGDTLSDLLRGFALGASSSLLALLTWLCRCCGFVSRVLPSAGRPVSRAAAESQPAAAELRSPEVAPVTLAKRRAGRGGALAHLAIESSQLG